MAGSRHELRDMCGDFISTAARGPRSLRCLFLFSFRNPSIQCLLLVAIMVTSPDSTLYSNLYFQLRENAVVTMYTPVHRGYKAAVIVAVALQLNTSLRELLISIKIGDSGAAAIAEALKLNTSLQ
jgi:hypothetical protein